MRIDLHVHSSRSDGTDTPAELVARARAAGLDLVALCDHDALDGVAEATRAGRAAGVAVLPGLELSCQREGVTVHLLGLGVRPDPGLLDELARIRAARDTRLDAILERLGRVGVHLTRDQVMVAAGRATTLGRPHVADAMVAAGYVADRTEAFRVWLCENCPGYVPHYRVPVADGIALVRSAGGVAVLAHAWGRTARSVLTPDCLAGLARPADGAAGLDGLEVDHQDHDPATRAGLRALAGRWGLIVTGASDYHGVGKVAHELGCNTTDVENWGRIAALITARGGILPAPDGVWRDAP